MSCYRYSNYARGRGERESSPGGWSVVKGQWAITLDMYPNLCDPAVATGDDSFLLSGQKLTIRDTDWLFEVTAAQQHSPLTVEICIMNYIIKVCVCVCVNWENHIINRTVSCYRKHVQQSKSFNKITLCALQCAAVLSKWRPPVKHNLLLLYLLYAGSFYPAFCLMFANIQYS